METMTRNQILRYTRCQFFISHPKLIPCVVTKKALRTSLKSHVGYSVDAVETGICQYGVNKGKKYYRLIILL